MLDVVFQLLLLSRTAIKLFLPHKTNHKHFHVQTQINTNLKQQATHY